MFELEIEREKKRCMDIMVERGDYTTLQRLCAIEGIPMFYKTFFAAHADWWIYELNQERASDRRFDYSDNSVVSLLQETDKVLRETVRFSAEEFLGLLDTAVKARLNFLCRPRTTLRWFVFRGEPTKTIHEVWLRLNYFYDYQYLTNGFREWAEKTYSDHPSPELLTVSDFENLIMEIDNTMILELTPHQFTDLLAPLYDFFAPSGQAADDYALPIEALIIFLDDKGVDLIAKELERMYYEEHTDKINREEFLNVVTTILSSLDDGEPQPIAEETEQPQSIEEVTEEDNFVLSPEFDEANSGFLGLIHSYSQTRDYVSVDKEESAALYMAEFMRDDSFVQDNIDAMREKPQLLNSAVLHNHDEESPTDDSEETIEQVMDEEIQSLQENEEEFIQMPSIEELVIDNPAEDTHDGTVEEIHLPDSLNLDKEESTETTQNEQQDTEIVDIAVNDIVAETVENAEQQTTTDAFHSDAAEATETASILPEDEEAVNSDERTVEPEHTTDSTTHSESHTHAEVYSLQEQNARGYIPSLSSKIDPAKRDTFIKKVFHKDPELFDTFVKDIDKTYSWKEAAAAIDRFYVRHNIKDSGAVAKELRTIIQKRYVR
ncbi:MAG TPA: hypothetical protein PLI74_01555 [Candidatus Kapabacteria bacterium]|nr:hypothetical protein [Candidatus Kapabacteria bacterium]